MDTREKIRSRDALPEGPYTLAHGRFSVLSADHCRALAEARAAGLPVVASVAADSDGGPYPLDQGSRAQLAAALAAVDTVVVCSAAELAEWRAALPAERVFDVEARAGRDVIADVLERHREG